MPNPHVLSDRILTGIISSGQRVQRHLRSASFLAPANSPTIFARIIDCLQLGHQRPISWPIGRFQGPVPVTPLCQATSLHGASRARCAAAQTPADQPAYITEPFPFSTCRSLDGSTCIVGNTVVSNGIEPFRDRHWNLRNNTSR